MSVDLEDGVDLYRDAERKVARAQGKPRVFSSVAKDINHQVRAAIDDGGVLVKVRGTIHEAAEFHAPGYAIKVALTGLTQGSKNVDAAQSRGLDRIILTYIVTDLAAIGETGRIHGYLAGNENETSSYNEWYVVGRWSSWVR